MIAAPIAPFPTPNLAALGALSPDELKLVLDTALEIKANQGAYNDLLRGKRLAMVFEKESLRTRFTFDIGMQDLGGSAVFLDGLHIDFSDDLIRSGFRFTNPNASGSCGCGASFAG